MAALLIGGIPALALTLAADEGSPSSSQASADEWQPGDGAPPWSKHRSAGPRADQDKAKPDKAMGPKAGRGNGHGVQMRAWAHCVATPEKPAEIASEGPEPEDGASEGPERRFDPEQACGKRPAPPGRERRAG